MIQSGIKHYFKRYIPGFANIKKNGRILQTPLSKSTAVRGDFQQTREVNTSKINLNLTTRIYHQLFEGYK